ncbi:MAG: TadE/TadG family type IV pilus assembly protein [Vulcanimicrobiaceae bacterium]
MIRRARGTALPETALMIGIVLLILLGASQLAIISFTQASVNGAAFIAAHEVASDPNASAASVINQAFPQLGNATVTLTPGNNVLSAVVTKSVGGFILLPGVASTYQVVGGDVEYAPTGVQATPAPFAFAVTATLDNYCPYHGSCSLPSSYSMYLAQNMNPQGDGNGQNGTFAEWQCHQQYFAALVQGNGFFPQARPTPSSLYDPNNHDSPEYPIYRWDTGSHTCNSDN